MRRTAFFSFPFLSIRAVCGLEHMRVCAFVCVCMCVCAAAWLGLPSREKREEKKKKRKRLFTSRSSAAKHCTYVTVTRGLFSCAKRPIALPRS